MTVIPSAYAGTMRLALGVASRRFVISSAAMTPAGSGGGTGVDIEPNPAQAEENKAHDDEFVEDAGLIYKR
jgi:hypothetical protein